MNILRYKFSSLLVLVTIYYSLDIACAQNATKMITIPILTTNLIGPKKFERISVPVHPTLPHPADIDDEKPVSERIMEVDSYRNDIKSATMPSNFADRRANHLKPSSYVTRSDNHQRSAPYRAAPKSNEPVPKEKIEHRSLEQRPKMQPVQKAYVGPNKIQPLNVNTKNFEKGKPDHRRQPAAERRKKFNDQEKRLKLQNLPQNPVQIPKTDWFDNHGKYNYGIVHEPGNAGENVDVGNVPHNEPPVVQKRPPVVTHHPPPPHGNIQPLKVQNTQNQPNLVAHVHHQNDNNGKFLYKSEVVYPQYRDHLYLPVITYYGDTNAIPKENPVYTTQTIHPPPPNNLQRGITKFNNAPIPPTKIPLPIPQQPKNSHPQVVNRKEPPIQKHPMQPVHKQSPPPPPPPPPKEEETEEEYYDDDEDNDNEEGGKADVTDYDEEDSSEDDEGDGDKYRKESAEESDEDDEEEEEEKPRYRYKGFKTRNGNDSGEKARYKYSSFKPRNDDDSEENEFDRAWRKYGYGPKESSEENDSSESKIVIHEVEPERKKIYHMKMEYYTAPHDGLDATESLSSVQHEKAKIRPRELNARMSGMINNNNDEKRKKNKRTSVKSQQQHPNAGPDDLKFFQYFNYLGNGEHRAGGRVGNEKHYIEQHERGSKVTGVFQKKVKWADKDGGFGEHYWDLNHGKK